MFIEKVIVRMTCELFDVVIITVGQPEDIRFLTSTVTLAKLEQRITLNLTQLQTRTQNTAELITKNSLISVPPQ